MTDLFSPTKLGDIEIANRVVMAPLTRNRAPELVATALTAQYYAQRASMGLLISEGTPVSHEGNGYAFVPGIWSQAQVAGWRQTTEAVHAAGGKIVAQLWHVGRVSHPAVNGGVQPVAPSALAAGAKTFTGTGFEDTAAPRALAEAEIAGVVAAFAQGAANAIAAGFDGVEIHGANGYLLDQFLRDSTNQRADGYGGSLAGRLRLLTEVLEAVVAEIGAGRVGLRISPWSNANNVGMDSDTATLFAAVAELANRLGLAFVHVVEGQTGGPRDMEAQALAALRAAIKVPYIANNGYDGALAEAALGQGVTAVSFGRLAIANPDLVARLKAGGPFNALKAGQLYGGGAEGYTDYPLL